jgi:hypothetical protein
MASVACLWFMTTSFTRIGRPACGPAEAAVAGDASPPGTLPQRRASGEQPGRSGTAASVPTRSGRSNHQPPSGPGADHRSACASRPPAGEHRGTGWNGDPVWAEYGQPAGALASATTSDQTFTQSGPDPEFLTSWRYSGPMPGSAFTCRRHPFHGSSLGHVTYTAGRTTPVRHSTVANRTRRSVT